MHRSHIIMGRRIFVTICVFLMYVLLCQSTWSARLVRVGTYQNPPKVSMSESGKAEGIFIDVLEAIAADEGWKLEYVPGTWAQGLDRLSAGKIDLMPDVAFTEPRKILYTFHKEPVLSDWFQIYARPKSGIRSILDLKGKRVSVLNRSIQQEAFDKSFSAFDLDIKLKSYPTLDSAFSAVKRGDVDAVVANRFYGVSHLRASGLEDTAVIFYPTRLFFASPKSGDPTILYAIDNRLSSMKKDRNSVYYHSIEHWTSEEIEYAMPLWLKLTALIAVLLMLFTAYFNIALRHQVSIQTHELRKSLKVNEQLYDELHQRAIMLEDRVHERTVELEAARDRAEAADRTKSAFLATMSHELRTPLNSIIGFTGLLLQGLAGPMNVEQCKQMGMIRASGQHLLDLINDVLDISKIEAGQIEITCVSYNLPASIMKVVNTITPLADKKSLLLNVHIAPDVTDTKGDSRRVEQVLLNLLSNAVKFTDHGDVTVRVTVDAGYYSIAVTDTGPGIHQDDIRKLFQPFKQIDTGLTRQYEGTGLGLAISKRLVEKMGGQISVVSTPGVGSTFMFTLINEQTIIS